MSQGPVSPARVLVLALVVPLAVVLGLAGACVESPRALGESCLKNEDCLSSSCINLVCASAPPLLDAEVDAEAGPPSTDGASDASDAAAPVDASKKDGAPATDAGTDAPPGDASSDVMSADAPSDASSDGATRYEDGSVAPSTSD